MAKTKTLEDNFRQLEELIGRLESDELSLDEAFKTYQTGVKLAAECNKQLDKVEKQIIILKEEQEEVNETTGL